MKQSNNEYIPNQGCGILFLLVISVFFLVSIPIFKFTHDIFLYYTETQILLTSDSPDETYI